MSLTVTGICTVNFKKGNKVIHSSDSFKNFIRLNHKVRIILSGLVLSSLTQDTQMQHLHTCTCIIFAPDKYIQ